MTRVLAKAWWYVRAVMGETAYDTMMMSTANSAASTPSSVELKMIASMSSRFFAGPRIRPASSASA